jgi:hypothetical protein
MWCFDFMQALSKLVAMCGLYHQTTTGAYILLIVVLCHTSYFSQVNSQRWHFEYRCKFDLTNCLIQISESFKISHICQMSDVCKPKVFFKILMS